MDRMGLLIKRIFPVNLTLILVIFFVIRVEGINSKKIGQISDTLDSSLSDKISSDRSASSSLTKYIVVERSSDSKRKRDAVKSSMTYSKGIDFSNKDWSADVWAKNFNELPKDETSINLSNSRISFESLKFLKEYKNLRRLSLFGCVLTNAEWCGLLPLLPSGLEELNLGCTEIDPLCLSKFEQFSKIKSLSLEGFRLSKEDWMRLMRLLPAGLVELNLSSSNIDSILEELSPDYTNISTTYLNNFSKLFRLKSLSLKQCTLTKENWKKFINLLPNGLKELNLAYSNYNGENFRDIYGLVLLRKLDIPLELTDNMLSDILLILDKNNSNKPGVDIYINGDQLDIDIIEKFSEISSAHSDSSSSDIEDSFVDKQVSREYDSSIALINSKEVDFFEKKFTEDEWLEKIKGLSRDVLSIDLSSSNISLEALRLLNELRYLTVLSLEHCQLSDDQSWEEVMDLLPKGLVELNLGNTKISFSGLRKLKRFSNLSKISLKGYELLSTEWVEVMSSLPPVKFIDLSYTNISYEHLQHLGRFHQLVELSLEGCSLTPEGWLDLMNLLSFNVLIELNLGNTNISFWDLKKLKDFSTLARLSLEDCQMEEADWKELMTLLPDALVDFNLDDTNIPFLGLRKIKRFFNLRKLSLKGCCLNDNEWQKIISILPPHLVELNLSGTNYSGECFEAIGVLKNLHTLKLPAKFNMDESMLKKIRQNLFEKHKNDISPCLCVNDVEYIGEVFDLEKEFLADYGENTNPEIYDNVVDFSNGQYSEIQWGIKMKSIPMKTDVIVLDGSNFSLNSDDNSKPFEKLCNLKGFSANRCEFDPDYWNFLMCNLGSRKSIESVEIVDSNFESKKIGEFEVFKKIKKLSITLDDLENNDLEDLFKCLNFDNLETLEIYSAYSDSDLFALGINFGNLKRLILVDTELTSNTWNNLIGSLPKDLEILDLEDSNYCGEIANHFKCLKKIKKLNLGGCVLPFSSWKVILESVDIDKIIELPENQVNISNKCVNFSEKKYYPQDWEEIISSLSPNLQRLSFHRSNYTGEQIERLQNLESLQFLDMSHVKMEPQKWKILVSNLPKSINYLMLEYSDYAGEGIEHLHSCLNLKMVGICVRKLSENSYQHLESIPDKLSEIDIYCADVVGYSGEEHSPDEWSELISNLFTGTCELNLNGSNYKGESIKHITELPLRKLDLTGCDLTSEQWDQLISNLYSGTCELILSGKSYKGECIKRITELPLRKLDLSGCELDDEVWNLLFKKNEEQ